MNSRREGWVELDGTGRESISERSRVRNLQLTLKKRWIKKIVIFCCDNFRSQFIKQKNYLLLFVTNLGPILPYKRGK